MAVSQDQIVEWLQANPNATDTDIAKAMNQYGVGVNQLARATQMDPMAVAQRYMNAQTQLLQNPNQPTAQQPQKQPWETLTSTSGANDVSNAYSAYLKSAGSQDTDATRQTANDYLKNLGMGDQQIAQSYSQFQSNNPQFSTKPNSIGAVSNAITRSGAAPIDVNSYSPNPYLAQAASSITNQVNQNLQRNILPGIQSNAQSVGGFGGSRQGVVEANALNDVNQGLTNSLTNMYYGDYNNAMNRNLQQQSQNNSYNLGLGNLGLGYQQAQNSYDLGLGNLGLNAQNSNNSFYTAQRGQDLQQAGLGYQLTQAANQGYLNQGTGLYDTGTQYQNAPWSAMQNFNSATTPYTGYGATSTTSQSTNPWAQALGGAALGAQVGKLF